MIRVPEGIAEYFLFLIFILFIVVQIFGWLYDAKTLYSFFAVCSRDCNIICYFFVLVYVFSSWWTQILIIFRSSCGAPPSPCSWGNGFHSNAGNPNKLYGALIAGPNKDGSFTDDRLNYVSNEVATDYNAGFQGAVAGELQMLPKFSYFERIWNVTFYDS